MGVDCVFVAENLRGITIQDIEQDSLQGEFPGGKGKFFKNLNFDSRLDIDQPVTAYCDIEFVNDLLVIHDGCRLGSNRSYQLKMIEYLKRKCGGQAGVWGDNDLEIDEDYHKTSTFNKEGWMQPVAEEDDTQVLLDP